MAKRLVMRRTVVLPAGKSGGTIAFGNGGYYHVSDPDLVRKLTAYDPANPDPAAWPEGEELPALGSPIEIVTKDEEG